MVWFPSETRLLVFSVFLIGACGPSESFEISYPEDFPPVIIPERNPTTKAGVELGRILFYDPILSKDSSRSCASCHVPSLAFTDGVATPEVSNASEEIHRNTPTLTNIAWAQYLFWDGGARDLESQAFAPISHPGEMASDYSGVVRRLQSSSFYPPRFYEAFGEDSIVMAYVARALAQFQRTLVSNSSRYDLVMGGAQSFSEMEMRGLTVFETECASCHPPPLFTDNGFHNIGLDSIWSAEFEYVTTGRFRITQDSMDLGHFKTPTLRNLAFTSPYMHDGRFQTLEEVLSHYAHGTKRNPFLDEALRGSAAIRLSPKERKDLAAFLSILNDSTFISPME